MSCACLRPIFGSCSLRREDAAPVVVDMSVLFLAVLGTDKGFNLRVHQNVPAGPGPCPPAASASSFAAFLDAKNCEWASMRLNARPRRKAATKLRSLQDASGVLLPAHSVHRMNSPPSPLLASAPTPGVFGHFHPPLPPGILTNCEASDTNHSILMTLKFVN